MSKKEAPNLERCEIGSAGTSPYYGYNNGLGMHTNGKADWYDKAKETGSIPAA